MNREIKFRVFNNKSKSWVHGPGEEVNLFGEMVLLGGFMKNTPLLEIFEDCVICQYTGLKDKNGKEIYEGDILQSTYQIAFLGTQTEKSTVEWRETTCSFIGIPRFTGEIIGNIFENPELLVK